MNLESLRRGVLPKATAEEIDHLLWSCTCYPFGGCLRKLRRMIRVALRNGGGTVDGAIAWAHDELDRAMAEFNAEAEKARERMG